METAAAKLLKKDLDQTTAATTSAVNNFKKFKKGNRTPIPKRKVIQVSANEGELDNYQMDWLEKANQDNEMELRQETKAEQLFQFKPTKANTTKVTANKRKK